MIVLKCDFGNKKIAETLFSKGIVRNLDQEIFNNFDDKSFFDFMYFKIEDALPIDTDEKYISRLYLTDYESIFNSFNLTQDELENQKNYLDAFTFPDKFYKQDMVLEDLEEIELDASIGSVECFPKFTKKGVVWDVSGDDWDEDKYRVYSGITFNQLEDFSLSDLFKLIQREKINDEILTEADILEWYPDWEDDKATVVEEIWDELRRINSKETRLGDLI